MSHSVLVMRHNLWILLPNFLSQVIAPFLVTIRVANQRALTGDAITSGDPGSIRFRSQGELTEDSSTLPCEYTPSWAGAHGEFRGESTLGDGSTVGGAPDRRG